MACYLDGKDRENPKRYKAGFGKNNTCEIGAKYLLAPVQLQRLMKMVFTLINMMVQGD